MSPENRVACVSVYYTHIAMLLPSLQSIPLITLSSPQPKPSKHHNAGRIQKGEGKREGAIAAVGAPGQS